MKPLTSAHELLPAEHDLAARRPVWGVLSELFLDTDVTRLRQHRVQVLAGSAYSLEAIERILVEEVYPVCAPNLWSVAGEWAGFDEAWLEARILACSRSRWRCLLRPARWRVLRTDEWRITRAAVLARRVTR